MISATHPFAVGRWRRAVPSTTWLVSLAGTMIFPWPVHADVVRLKNGTVLRGEIKQYDERGLILEVDGERPIQKSIQDVASVQTTLLGAHRDGDRAWSAGDVRAAANAYELALSAETRPWARQRLRSALLRAWREEGEWEKAADAFLELFSQRDDPEVIALAPLPWRDENVGDRARERARGWRTDPQRPIARLIAASWLSDPAERAATLKILRGLQVGNDQRIAWMARAQYQRLRDDVPQPDEIKRYQEMLERVPQAARVGPQFVLGQLLEKSHRLADAAVAYLWIPFALDPRSPIARSAIERAARAADRAGLRDEADRLRAELAKPIQPEQD